MRNKTGFCAGLSNSETVWGVVYVLFQNLVLSGLLVWINSAMDLGLNGAELNFLYYLTNFLATIVIYREFLSANLRQVFRHPAWFCQAVILGFAAYEACRRGLGLLSGVLLPEFTNYNDAAISNMAAANGLLMFLGTVVLVPAAEECVFRGLIFRNLYGRSRWAAYGLSMVTFALIHILGYVGHYGLGELAFALVQYLPAGLCLAWSYAKSGTVFAPITLHALINFLAFRSLR